MGLGCPLLRYRPQAGACRNGRRQTFYGRLVALRPREFEHKVKAAASLPLHGTGAALTQAPELLQGGAGKRDTARASKGHMPWCHITKVMGTKHVSPKASPSGGVWVVLGPRPDPRQPT